MSLLSNNKKGNNQKGNNNQQKNTGGGSKFIKGPSKPGNLTKKVRSTGANRGS